MRLSRIVLALVVISLIGVAFLKPPVLTTRAQAGQDAATPRYTQADTTAPREIDFPYYSLRDGFNSTLLLVNASPKPTDLFIAIRSLSGQTRLAPALTIEAQEKLSFDLATLLSEL
ncbi:MAG: hypothetical protein DMG23_00110 [Acidobacteria bacterium]|nr:MAG: hypothetical protein DMG23_00110 [Acidobacteriota bacterium]